MSGTASQLHAFDVLHAKNRWPEGDVYFCSGWGNDANSGEDPDAAIKTIEHALTHCRAQRDDSIVVYASPGDTTFPIDINVEGVHLFGFPYGFHDSCNINPSANTAGFLVTASKVTIDGFYVGAGAAHGCIEWDDEAKWLLRITNCNFGMFRGTPLHGFKNLSDEDVPYLVIADCYFGHTITDSGIKIGNATRGYIGLPGHGNVFQVDSGQPAINVTGDADLAGIYDNRFMLYADTAGLAITLADGNANCFVDGNHAGYGNSAMSTNPYKDLGASNWGLNYRQGLSILPVTS